MLVKLRFPFDGIGGGGKVTILDELLPKNGRDELDKPGILLIGPDGKGGKDVLESD